MTIYPPLVITLGLNEAEFSDLNIFMRLCDPVQHLLYQSQKEKVNYCQENITTKWFSKIQLEECKITEGLTDNELKKLLTSILNAHFLMKIQYIASFVAVPIFLLLVKDLRVHL